MEFLRTIGSGAWQEMENLNAPNDTVSTSNSSLEVTNTIIIVVFNLLQNMLPGLV